MNEVMLKTHLIIKDIHEEYIVKWFGGIAQSKPLIKNNKPVFIVRGSEGTVTMNTIDIKHIEKIAKKLTNPRGREAFTSDTAYIYIKEVDGNEKALGKVVHNHIKKYAPMYDAFEYKEN